MVDMANTAEQSEKEFLESYNPDEYEKPSVTVDLVLFTIIDEKLHVLLTRRPEHPAKGKLALAGTFLQMDETLPEAVERVLQTKTGLRNIYFEQLFTWGEIKRDPRMRVLSVSYYALVPKEQLALPENDFTPQFYPVEEIAAMQDEIAFDHAQMIEYGRERIRNKVYWSDIAFALVPEEFTLPQLQKVFEIILGRKLYKANFRKRIAPKIIMTDKMTSGAAHRPSRIYRKKPEEDLQE